MPYEMNPKHLCLVLLLLCARSGYGQPEITLRLDQPGHAVPAGLYGLMTEEINYSYDGGLYAELIRNRDFKDNRLAQAHWAMLMEGGASGMMTLDYHNPVNAALSVSMRLEAQVAGTRIGILDSGYWGIPVKPGTTYTASFYAKGTRSVPLTASIESNDGKTVYAKAQTAAIGGDWQQYKLTLNTAADVKPTADARFILSTTDTGTYWFDLVSLFPPTYKNTPNGNRPDIMQLLADMKPSFLRFPGGNYLEGDYFSSRFDWKKTIGGLERRPGHLSPWGYHSTDGMGLYEFLLWCEDLHMEPLLAVFAGYTLKGDYLDDSALLRPFVDEALDEIEYVTGDPGTKWGSIRARDGHPAPFPLHYVEIGNEDGFDRSGSYEKRFDQFATAIRARFPQLKLISTVGGKKDWLSGRFSVPQAHPDVVDEHYYRNAIEMEEMATLYDTADRHGPKIFVGEWASREGYPTTNLNAALGDAAFLTGLERNSDLVIMSCYAPLFVNVNPGGMQWRSDLIGYNALTSYGSPSYHVQKLFSQYLGDQTVVIEAKGLPTQVKTPSKQEAEVTGARPVTELQIDLSGEDKVASEGKTVTIGSTKPEDTNTITEPDKVVPVTAEVKGLGKRFKHSFPAYSVTVLVLMLK
jgi:alpha-N-arabinofuranosidase